MIGSFAGARVLPARRGRPIVAPVRRTSRGRGVVCSGGRRSVAGAAGLWLRLGEPQAIGRQSDGARRIECVWHEHPLIGGPATPRNRSVTSNPPLRAVGRAKASRALFKPSLR